MCLSANRLAHALVQSDFSPTEPCTLRNVYKELETGEEEIQNRVCSPVPMHLNVLCTPLKIFWAVKIEKGWKKLP